MYFTLWHNWLVVNYGKMISMKKLLSNYGGDKPWKRDVCIQAKVTKNLFSNVTRSTIADLIHSDTSDFKSIVTRDSMRYFITFINDHSRFCHVYSLKSKDETFSKFLSFRFKWRSNLGVHLRSLETIEVASINRRKLKYTSRNWHHCRDDCPLLPAWNCRKEEPHSLRW